MAKLSLVATSAFGLEAVVVRELEALGYGNTQVADGRVAFEGDETAICRTNLWLRAADRVLVRLGEFPASDFDELFDGTRALDWASWLPPDAAFPVRGKSVRSQLHGVPACQSIVKKAIVESLRQAHARRLLPESGPEFSVEVSLVRDMATLTLDTSGAGLHKRGYRRRPSEAPLKETLAAGLVLLTRHRPEELLLDPFCGSGTLPIEAALIAKNLAPGIAREFAAQAWPRIPAATWQRARDEARALLRQDVHPRIAGSDVDGELVATAREHAQLAGVAADVRFEANDFRDLASSHERGVLVCNPPYGERSGDEAQALAIHREMPQAFGVLEGWSYNVLTAVPDFERMMGRRADKRRKLYNGRIACTFYQFLPPRRGKSR